ncbi:MAG: hypothetical protein AAF184_24745 [Pseudomonadota bacterium]
MAEEYPPELKLYDHVPNSGIVHMPNRRFPGVALQGDSLSVMLSDAVYFMERAVAHGDEELFDCAQDLAERLKWHLTRYEDVLSREGFERPYTIEVGEVDVESDFDSRSPESRAD